MACLLGIPKLQYTHILTPDCQPAFNPALRLGAGQAGGLLAACRDRLLSISTQPPRTPVPLHHPPAHCHPTAEAGWSGVHHLPLRAAIPGYVDPEPLCFMSKVNGILWAELISSAPSRLRPFMASELSVIV